MRALHKIRVLVVDDSIFFRKALEQDLSNDMHLEIVSGAVDAEDAMKKILEYKPNVVTLDVEMPKMNGIEFLKKLMPEHPVAVVVVTGSPISALDALEAGAVDFVKKPLIKTPKDRLDFVSDLTLKVKIAATARVGKPKVDLSKIASATHPHITGTVSKSTDVFDKRVIAIGASTGGTEATLSIIKDLPATTPGIVVTQHMPAGFTKMYAERLDRICKMRVKEAQHLDRVVPGQIIIAAGGQQMTLHKDANGYYIKSQEGEKVSGHCPSVDVLFQSTAKAAGKNALGIILTGMGSDGAKGLLEMRENGGNTFGQDKESCVVYGMPMVAQNIGAVCKQMPLSAMTDEIISAVNKI